MKLTFVVFLLFIAVSAIAQEMTFDKESGQAIPKYVGELKIFKGKVYKKKPQGRLTEIKPGTRFFKNDTLVTEGKSFAKILIVDDTELTIGPNSELNFEEFKYLSKTDRNIVYSFIKGQLKAAVKNKAGEDDLIFKTKNATLGVRGTQILINHQILNNLDVSEFALESGNAVVKDRIKNLQHDLQKNDRVIIVRNAETNEATIEQNTLTTDELEMLKDKENFMPYFRPQNFSLNSLPSPDLVKEEELISPSPKRSEQPKGSFYNLQKLNEKLRENQKIR
jgi:hypothetical protein